MRVVYYLLALVCGLFGALGALRTLERLVTGQGVMAVQVAFGMAFLFLAWKCVQKARARSKVGKQEAPPTGTSAEGEPKEF